MKEQGSIGYLDNREPGAGGRAICKLLPPGIVIIAEDMAGLTAAQIYLDANQSLNLLAWLEQERATLEEQKGASL